MRIFCLLLAVALGGCGYHTPGASHDWAGGDARHLYVALFDNLTAEPYLENYITDALVAELSRSRLVTLTEAVELADVRLLGEVKDFHSHAVAYGTTDQITEYRATMTVAVRLVGRGGEELLWSESLQRSEDYLASVSKNLQLEGERLAAQQVARRLAEDIYASLLNSF